MRWVEVSIPRTALAQIDPVRRVDLERVFPSPYLFVIRPAVFGQVSAQSVGVPNIYAEAATQAEAIAEATKMLIDWLTTARWVQVEVPTPMAGHLLMESLPRRDPNDPLEKEYLEELARMRREDREQTLREYDQACPNSSSTPTT